MPAYNRLLDEQAIGSKRSGLHIELKHPGEGRFGERGIYIHDPNEIRRDLSNRSSGEVQDIYPLPTRYMGVLVEDAAKTPGENDLETNRTLRHETKHFIQDARGGLLTQEQKKRRQRLYGAAVAAGGIILAAIGTRFTGLNPAETAALLSFGSPFAIVPGHFIGKEIEYHTNPNEKDARRFTDEPSAERIFSSNDLG